MEETKYIVLASNSNLTVTAFGTATGKLYASESAAERARKQADKKYAHLDFIVLPIQPLEL